MMMHLVFASFIQNNFIVDIVPALYPQGRPPHSFTQIFRTNALIFAERRH
jgi:hypothetical protein